MRCIRKVRFKMILPSKVVPVEKSLLYKSIKYFKSTTGSELIPKCYDEIMYITILYSINYVTYRNEGEGNGIRVYKVK